jgi:hypothetical protein
LTGLTSQMANRLRWVTDELPIETAPSGPGPTPGPISYRLVMFRPLTFTVLFGLGLVGVAIVLNLLTSNNGPGGVFVVLWLAAYAWNAYWFLVRIAYEVGIVDGSTLRWRSITTRHEIPLSRIKGIRTPFPPFGAGAKKILLEGGPSPLIMVSPGFRDVVAMVLQFRPDLVNQMDWYDRLAERFSRRAVSWRRL